MDIEKTANSIDLLEKEVQRNTNSYMLDTDCTSIIDSQLNGHIKEIQTYCKLNNLISFSESIADFFPINQNAIDFFCLWDGIKADILEHSTTLQGKERQRVIFNIACELQSLMTASQIDAYLGGFSVPITGANYTCNSKRVYVENLLKMVDGSTIMNIAKDLNLICADIIETKTLDKTTSEFVQQQISKCKKKMNTGDYDGAITNARTLVEEVLLSIEKELAGDRQEYDGNLPSLYKRVSKQINMFPDTKTENSFNEILRGFISIVNGFAGISNNIADRHATTKHPKKHHAKVAVNSALIISEFLLDSFDYQRQKSQQ